MDTKAFFLFPMVIILVVIIILIAQMMQSVPPTKTGESKSITAHATDIVESCATADYTPFCYEQTVPDLLLSLIHISEPTRPY